MKKRNVYTILKILNEVLVLFSCGLGDQYSIDAINFIIAKQDSTKLSIFINKKTTSTMFMSVLIVMLVQIRTYVPTSTRLWLFDVKLTSTLGISNFGFTEKGSPNGVTVKDCLRKTAKCDFDQRYDITVSKRNC